MSGRKLVISAEGPFLRRNTSTFMIELLCFSFEHLIGI